MTYITECWPIKKYDFDDKEDDPAGFRIIMIEMHQSRIDSGLN